MKYLLMVALALGLYACGDDEEPAKTEALTAEQRADNPLLNYQDETVNKAEKAIQEGLDKQQEALDSIGQ